MPDGGCEGEDPLGDAGADAFDGAAAVQFEVELALEGVVDGLDELADGFEQVLTLGHPAAILYPAADRGPPGPD